MEDSYNELNKFSSYASEKSEGREIQDLKGKIVLEDAFFQYPEQKNPIFESLNLKINPGEIAVIVVTMDLENQHLLNHYLEF